MGKDWAGMIQDVAQEQIEEPVLAAGILQPSGTWGSMGFGQLSGLVGNIMRIKNNKKAGGMAKQGIVRFRQALVACTEHKVYAFNSKPSRGAWKVTEPVGSWDRSDLRVTMADKKITKAVTIDVVSSGEHFELEATTVGSQGINDALFAELAKMA